MHSCLTPATCVWKVTVFLGPVGVLVTYLLKLASSRRRGGGQYSSTQSPCRWFNPGQGIFLTGNSQTAGNRWLRVVTSHIPPDNKET